MSRTLARRTPEQERALYNGLSPAAFAAEIGASVDLVYDLIGQGWFTWTKDDAGRKVPECQDTRRPGGRKPHYRIHRNAVPRWFTERAVTGGK
jgi:hypothetical protein